MAHSFPEAPSFGHASDDRSMPSETDERRIDERFAVRGPCAYELIDRQGADTAVSHGQAFSLNVSAEGILLLLDQKPQIRQLLELHNPALTRRHAVTLFEIRWAKKLPLWTTHDRYLVGCHLTFGRFPYFLFQRGHLDQHISGFSL
ncbi:MAG: hypothetical protein KF814_08350 [Nitrospiraceae bacterium]|nr:hypothetical protein [Nitrospiraceae bacterium]